MHVINFFISGKNVTLDVIESWMGPNSTVCGGTTASFGSTWSSLNAFKTWRSNEIDVSLRTTPGRDYVSGELEEKRDATLDILDCPLSDGRQRYTKDADGELVKDTSAGGGEFLLIIFVLFY